MGSLCSSSFCPSGVQTSSAKCEGRKKKMVIRKRKRGFSLFFCGLVTRRRRSLKSAAATSYSLLLAERREEEEERKKSQRIGGDDVPSFGSSFRFGEFPLPTPEKANSDEDQAQAQGQYHVSTPRIYSIEYCLLPILDRRLIRFDYEDLRLATSDFSNDRILGKGAHSCVYRGRLMPRRPIAVKRLKVDMKDADKDFCRELHIAKRLSHHNIVPLIGFCVDSRGLFLVYKYVSGGSLEHHLHKTKEKDCLPWSTRFRIAKGIAKALAYMHGDGSQQCIVHRDIKPSNILLSSLKTPKICDFGLATTTDGADAPFMCKSAKGTFGYLAPEYFQHGKVSSKTDIYAFGVVLLELLTGRQPIQEEKNLVVWASPKLCQGKIADLIDWRLRDRYNVNEAQRLMIAACSCLHPTDDSRGSMAEILSFLKGSPLMVTSPSRPNQDANEPKLFLSFLKKKSHVGRSSMKVSASKRHVAIVLEGLQRFRRSSPAARSLSQAVSPFDFSED